MRTTPDVLTHERAALFMDYQDTHQGLARAGRQVDLTTLRDYLAEGRHLVEAFVYVATHPQPAPAAEDQAMTQRLHRHGFLVRSQPGRIGPDGSLNHDFTLDMALDIQDFVARSRPDILILATCRESLAPLVQRLRLQGVRVEVAAAPGVVSPTLRALANGFIDLTQASQRVANLPIPALGEDEDDEPDPADQAIAPIPVA